MRALLHQATFVQHEDQVGREDGAQAMGNDQAAAPFHHPLQRLLDQRLALGIEVAGRLIQNEHAGILEDHAGDGHPLLLAARQPVAPLANDGVVPLGQASDEIVDIGSAASRL